MPGLFRGVPPTREQQLANDRHRFPVVVAVLAAILLYAYLFTSFSGRLGLPRPAEISRRLGFSSSRVFTELRYVHSNVRIPRQNRFDGQTDALLAYFGILAAAFLCAYYLPLEKKQAALVFWSATALWIFYGTHVVAALLAAHLMVYLLLHPQARCSRWLSAGLGAAVCVSLLRDGKLLFLWAPLAAVGSWAVYRFLIMPALARAGPAGVLRGLAVHSAIIVCTAGAMLNAFGMPAWTVPLGVLIFFWQWQRVWMYFLDYQDGLVPKDLPLHRYLAVFWTPGAIPSWYWGVSTGQGYAYTAHNYLCEDKNKIVLSGLRIWGVALLYLVMGEWARVELLRVFERLGVSVHEGYTQTLVADFMNGEPISGLSVLITTLLSVVGWILYVVGMLHFKVGVWRICGYRMDPDFDRPWQATNLAVFWSRFMFHYRAFLVRAFYYPVFFNWLKGSTNLRLFAAVFAAAGFGNWIWGHLTERLYGFGLEAANIVYVLDRFPYFLLLAGGIAGSQWFLLRKQRLRRPWTWDRWLPLDVLCSYATLQYYSLILIFARPAGDAGMLDLLRLFVKIFGIG